MDFKGKKSFNWHSVAQCCIILADTVNAAQGSINKKKKEGGMNIERWLLD